MNRVVISVGSNVSDGDSRIREALALLDKYVTVVSPIYIYSTPPVGGIGNDYFNAVVAGDTLFGIDELSEITKRMEIIMGRDDKCRACGVVPVDLDIVIFNDEVLRARDFTQDYFRIGYSRLPSDRHI